MSADQDPICKINFDSHWRCCQHPLDQLDDVTLSTFVSMHHYHNWSSTKLPHTDAPTESPSPHWWYRKHFHWLPSGQQLYLSFRSLDDHPRPADASVTIWLNEKQILTGTLTALDQPIDLSTHLLSNEAFRNTLLIFCVNTTLCYHARLLVYGKLIYATGEVQLGEGAKKSLHYTVSLDHHDGQFALSSDSKEPLSNQESPIEHTSSNQREELPDDASIPRLAVAILIVGTRGDVQPFIALGQALLAAGHRVRLATHEVFRSFVRGNGLEFYPLAGDPADLMAFMVKNTGMIPSINSIISGDVTKKRQSLAEIMTSTWKACMADDDETSLPFRADAIIANPPSFGHIHCAEKLQIPLHIMFTMPWSRTGAFPHPLCNVERIKGSVDTVNRYSYDAIDLLVWTGMNDIVNQFRKETLHLPRLRTRDAVRAMIEERVPHTYCWSPSVVPKPADWGLHIDVSGFFFLDLGTAYADPSKELLDFLGISTVDMTRPTLPPPIYIGFGSITGHDSVHLLSVIMEALKKTNYRALIAGFDGSEKTWPDNVLPIGNVPHDWLFQYVSCVCHHGGAGTTAAALRAGKPTIIVPFFGDQFFWGNAVERIGAGPRPLPGKTLTVDQLVEAFHFAHTTPAREAAERIRTALLEENGCQAAVRAFHANLPLSRMRSDLEPTFAACYRLEKYDLQVSRPVAQALVSAGVIDETELSDHATREWRLVHSDQCCVPSHGLVQHTSKAFTKIFVDTTKGHAATSARDNAQSVVKGVGQGLGHLSLGCLSLYGEFTDALDPAPSLYDPYSESHKHCQQHVTGLKSGLKNARKSLWHGWKEGVAGIVKEPYSGYKQRGKWGGAGGVLLGTANVIVKPVSGTLSSITWLGRGTYASMKKAVKNIEDGAEHSGGSTPKSGSVSPALRSDANESDEQNADFSEAVRRAAEDSGFHPRICQRILTDFEQIKLNRSVPPPEQAPPESIRL